MLFSQREIQAMLVLLNRTPMSLPEQLQAEGFFQRLAQFCQPPPEPMKDALDKTDEEKSG